jgi:hypothetical protein
MHDAWRGGKTAVESKSDYRLTRLHIFWRQSLFTGRLLLSLSLARALERLSDLFLNAVLLLRLYVAGGSHRG